MREVSTTIDSFGRLSILKVMVGRHYSGGGDTIVTSGALFDLEEEDESSLFLDRMNRSQVSPTHYLEPKMEVDRHYSDVGKKGTISSQSLLVDFKFQIYSVS